MKDERKIIRVFTAFSGYDSQCLALNKLSRDFPDFHYELVGWSEINKDAIKAHNILFPDAADKNYGDISKIDWNEVPDFDLFTYSSPCQDFSLAGKQQGAEEGSGTRSSLLWECKRCIEQKRPKYLLLENVSALVSKKFFPLFERWMDTIHEYGYENFWSTLNAKDFGVPQNRDRVFLVSILKEGNESVNYNFPTPPHTECSIEDILEPVVNDGYFINQETVNKWAEDNEQRIKEYVAERNGTSINDYEYDSDCKLYENSEVEFENESIETMPEEYDIIDSELLEDGTVKITVHGISSIEKVEINCKLDELGESEEEAKEIVENTKRGGKTKMTPLRGGFCVIQIATPTTSYGAAPTIMATGYESADYKNFFSVGHFPKLGVMEVWSDGTDTITDYTHNNKFNKLI